MTVSLLYNLSRLLLSVPAVALRRDSPTTPSYPVLVPRGSSPTSSSWLVLSHTCSTTARKLRRSSPQMRGNTNSIATTTTNRLNSASGRARPAGIPRLATLEPEDLCGDLEVSVVVHNDQPVLPGQHGRQ